MYPIIHPTAPPKRGLLVYFCLPPNVAAGRDWRRNPPTSRAMFVLPTTFTQYTNRGTCLSEMYKPILRGVQVSTHGNCLKEMNVSS